MVVPVNTINDKYQEGSTQATLQRTKAQRTTVARQNGISRSSCLEIFIKVIFFPKIRLCRLNHTMTT